MSKPIQQIREALRKAKSKASKIKASVAEAWACASGADKASVAIMGLAVVATIIVSAAHFSKTRLESRYASVPKLTVTGVAPKPEEILPPQEGLSALEAAKSDPAWKAVSFTNTYKAQGKVGGMLILRTKEGARVFEDSRQNIEALSALAKEQGRESALRVVDYETVGDQEKEDLQGLALRLYPTNDTEKELVADLLLGTLNVAVTGLMLYFLVQMVRQSRKSLRMIPPNKIKGDIGELIGMEDIKQELSRISHFLQNREECKAYGIDRPNNILFSGPPGTGKTKLAGYLAKQLHLPILFHSAANLETGFVNGGGQTLEQILAMAKKAKRCIVFLDEAQDLFMQRGKGSRKFDDDTQNMLLAILDGVRTVDSTEIIWVVASNFNANTMNMDEAMLRRFQLKIDFRLPNPAEREAIFKHYLSKAKDKLCADLDLETAVCLTEGCSPADIESIVYSAGMKAASDKALITTGLLLSSLERMLVGNTDEETTSGRERERRIIALHEIGHFLVDAIDACGGDLAKAGSAKDRIHTIKISLKANARNNALGFVFKKPRSGMLQTKKEFETEVMRFFGGMANEQTHFGADGVTNGAYSDIAEATRLIDRAVRGLGLYKNSKINLSCLAPSHLAHEVSQEDRQIMESVSAELYDKTLAMLAPCKELSETLAQELMARTEMTGEEMLELIAKSWQAPKADCAPETSQA